MTSITSTLLLLIACTTVMATSEAVKSPRSQFEGPLFDRLSEFFSLENVGQTGLGKLLAWKGDHIQPVALFGLGVFAVYTIFRIALTLLGGVVNVKSGILGRLFMSLNTLTDNFLSKLSGIEEVDNMARRKRDIDAMVDYLYRAVDKYESSQ